MKISQLIDRLTAIKDREGDIEVTCTGSMLPDNYSSVGRSYPDVFETTVENLIVGELEEIGKRVRLHR